MGSSIKGYLSKNVSSKDIFDIIVSNYDKNAIMNMTYRGRFTTKQAEEIFFRNGNKSRSIYYYIDSESIKKTQYDGSNEYVCISLSNWGNSVDIITDIVKKFGGYIDNSDSDEIELIYIPKIS